MIDELVVLVVVLGFLAWWLKTPSEPETVKKNKNTGV